MKNPLVVIVGATWLLASLFVLVALEQGRTVNVAAKRYAHPHAQLVLLAILIGWLWLPLVLTIGIKAALRPRKENA